MSQAWLVIQEVLWNSSNVSVSQVRPHRAGTARRPSKRRVWQQVHRTGDSKQSRVLLKPYNRSARTDGKQFARRSDWTEADGSYFWSQKKRKPKASCPVQRAAEGCEKISRWLASEDVNGWQILKRAFIPFPSFEEGRS